MNKSDKPKNILIIKLEQIGDAIMTTGLVHDLKSYYPNASIDVLVGPWSEDIFRFNPYIRNILIHKAPWWTKRKEEPINLAIFFLEYIKLIRRLRRVHYDIVIEARGDIRQKLLYAWASKASRRLGFDRQGGNFLLTDVIPYEESKHEMLKLADFLNLLGLQATTFKPEIFHTIQEEHWFNKLVSDYQLGSYFIIHPGAKKINRWPISNYIEVAKYLDSNTSLSIVLTGSETEKKLTQAIHDVCPLAINLTSQTNLLQLSKLIEKSCGILSGDTSVIHIAAASGILSFVLFGPTSYIRFGSLYPNCYPIISQHQCIENLHEKCSVTKSDMSYCLHSINYEKVVETISTVFSEIRRKTKNDYFL